MSTPTSIFAQRGNTRRITAHPWPVSTSIRMSVGADFPQANNYIITNFGPSTAFIGYGNTADDATTNARIPEPGDAGQFCFIIPPGQRGIEAKHGVYFAAVTATGTADIFITPGHGTVDGFGFNASADQASTADLGSLFLYESGTQQELLRTILVELRTQTEFLKQGLNVADDPESIRGDQTMDTQ